MAALVTATVVGGSHSSYLALDIAVGVVSVLLVPFLARWPVQTALLLSVLSAVSPAATPPATMATLIVARWQRLSLALAVAGTGVAAHLIRGTWRPLNGLPYVWWTVLILVAYAGALAYRPDAPPAQLSRAAEVIRSGVHESLDELRGAPRKACPTL